MVFLRFSLFRALQERPEALMVLLDAHCIVSETILGAFWSSGLRVLTINSSAQRGVRAARGRLQTASAASGQPLVSL